MFMFHLVVKPHYFDKPTSRSLRRALLALHDQKSFNRVDKLGNPHPSWINLIGLMYKKQSTKRSGIPTSNKWFLSLKLRPNPPHLVITTQPRKVTEGTNIRHSNQSSKDLNTQAISFSPFPPTRCPSQCMEALESL